MKKLILALVLLSVFANAQHSKEQTQIIRLGINPKIVFDGPYDYSEHGEFSGTLSWVTRFKNKNEGGIYIEYTKLNPDYYSGGFIFNKNIDVFYRDWIETYIGTEFLFIQRGTSYKSNGDKNKQFFLTGGINAITNFNIFKGLQIGLRLNLKYRPDLVELWNGNKTSWGGFINVGFKFY